MKQGLSLRQSSSQRLAEMNKNPDVCHNEINIDRLMIRIDKEKVTIMSEQDHFQDEYNWGISKRSEQKMTAVLNID